MGTNESQSVLLGPPNGNVAKHKGVVGGKKTKGLMGDAATGGSSINSIYQDAKRNETILWPCIGHGSLDVDLGGYENLPELAGRVFSYVTQEASSYAVTQ